MLSNLNLPVDSLNASGRFREKARAFRSDASFEVSSSITHDFEHRSKDSAREFGYRSAVCHTASMSELSNALTVLCPNELCPDRPARCIFFGIWALVPLAC